MIWILLVLNMQIPPPIPFPTLASPTPVPSFTPVILPTFDGSSAGGIMNYLATAQSAMSTPAPTFLAPVENGSEIFGYAKWLIDPSTTEELLGPVAPIANHIATIVGILLAMAALFVIIFLVVLIVRFIIWIITVILKFVPFMG